MISFFTIESDVLSGIVSVQLARRADRDGVVFRVARLAALFGMTPIAMVLGWLLFGPRPRIAGRTIIVAQLWPVVYLAYTLVRGAIWHWYPYPFLDVAAHGYLPVVVNSVGVTAVFALVAGLLLTGDRRLRPAP